MDKKHLWIILAVLAILIICCFIFILIFGISGKILFDRASENRATATAISVYEETDAFITPPADQQAEPDPEIFASMDEIQMQVTEIRGLNLLNSVPREFLSSDELKEIVTNDFLEDYTPEDASQDAAVLSLFGLLPADFDLLQFYKDLYSEQIAGYYDSEEKAMYVVKGEAFTGVERATYAHEYTHALQDEAFDFEGKLNYTEEACEDDSERCYAIQSLMEGDATLTELLWFQNYATPQDLKDYQDFYNSYASPIFDSAPAFMQVDFLFPYEYGLEFVQALHSTGGYTAINRAFSQQEPVSTEQIMHPSRYPSDLPIAVELPDLAAALGSDWEVVDDNVMGEWYTYLILAKGYENRFRIQESLAFDAAEGWGGDRYMVLENQEDQTFAAALATTWDSERDAEAALNAFRSYTRLRFTKAELGQVMTGDGYYSSLLSTGENGFAWLIANDEAALLNMMEAFQP